MPNYTSLFEILGVYARAFTQLDNLAGRNLLISESGEVFRSLDRLRQEFIDVLNDSGLERDRLDAVTILADAARNVRGIGAQLQQSLEAFVREGAAAELGLRGAAVAEVLAELKRAMLADEESVEANAVAITGVQAGDANAGDAPCYASITTTDAEENLVPDERARTQNVLLECTRDAAHHRVPAGQEEFRIAPENGPALATRVIPVTAGDFADARNAIMDGAFESHSGVFAHWPVQSGGGLFSRDTGVKLFGGGALKITGDGVTSGEIRQDMLARDPAIASGRFWALGAWVRASGITAGSVTIDLLVDGAPSALALVIDDSTPDAQWLHKGGIEYLPRASFPNKVIVRIRASADFDGVVNIDGVSLAPATEVPHAGLRVAVFQGTQAPQASPIADRYVIATTSDDAGAFQTFMRDKLGIALPSDDPATIDDDLAK